MRQARASIESWQPASRDEAIALEESSQTVSIGADNGFASLGFPLATPLCLPVVKLFSYKYLGIWKLHKTAGLLTFFPTVQTQDEYPNPQRKSQKHGR